MDNGFRRKLSQGKIQIVEKHFKKFNIPIYHIHTNESFFEINPTAIIIIKTSRKKFKNARL